MTGVVMGSGLAEDQEAAASAALPDVLQVLDAFEPISLAQTTRWAPLLHRSERKYVLPQRLLATVLSDVASSYRLLIVAERTISRYRSLYFDTPDLAMYFRHHAGAPNRYKVRSREYVDSQAFYLEVKHRQGGRRMAKQRMPLPGMLTAITPEAAHFLSARCPYPAEDLTPVLWSSHSRITLVSKTREERVTLDLDLAYRREDEIARLPGIVLAEIKYRDALYESDFARLMQERLVRSTGFSKYCLGVSLLYPDVKHNRFKKNQRLITRVQGEEYGRA